MQLLLALLCLVTACQAASDARVDCFPEPDASKQLCESRNCIWDSNVAEGGPWCYYPSGTGYTLSSSSTANPLQLVKSASASNPPNPYQPDISPLPVSYSTIGATLNIKIGSTSRYQPPLRFPKNPSVSADKLSFQVTTGDNGIFAFKVVRSRTGISLWDTSIGGMLFADQFIQIATFLPSFNIFGFGEHIHQTLKHNLNRYTTWPMFARDIGPDSGSALSVQNLYGVHPYYIGMEPTGDAHGVLILNSNAQEVTTGPGPHLVYRTIGGIIDLYFFPGPTPEEVVTQYLALIGTPFLPAYWALGFQLSRWGYANLDDMKAAVKRTQDAGVPLEIPYADIDYMDHDKDFTEGWVGFNDYVDELHKEGLHVILIFDPAIEVDYNSFNRSENQNVSYIEWPRQDLVPANIENQYPMLKDKKIMLGNVWPEKNTAFPDFLDTSDNTMKWWASEFKTFHSSCRFDGAWIDMNEPSNFETNVYSPTLLSKSDSFQGQQKPTNMHLSCPISGPDSKLDMPPYQTWAVFLHQNEYLCSKTVCMLGRSGRASMNIYDTKNLYGWSEAVATASALRQATGKRGAVISRSTFVSSGHFGGHWLGDNTARWEDLRTSVIGAQEFNMFGIPYVGSDICGFNGATTEELCLRWHQMGAFHPFSRNHNAEFMPAQDPAQWKSVTAAAKTALKFRYTYLPYLYSLMFSSTLYGKTVIRPLFFEFPQDFDTYEISYQFLWGPSLLITPVVYQGAVTVRGYLPSATWYSVYDIDYASSFTPGYYLFSAPQNTLIPVHVRGGSILPRQGASTTIASSRLLPFEVLVATEPKTSTAKGELYWDDGDSPLDDISTFNYYHWNFTFEVTAAGAQLSIMMDHAATGLTLPTLDVIEVFGYPYYPVFSSFTLNGNKVNINTQTSTYSGFQKRLYIKTANLIDIKKSSNVLAWTNSS